MNRNELTTGSRKIVLVTLAIVVLTGCGSTTDWIRGRVTPEQSNEPTILGAPDVGEYIKELGQIASGDPAAQAEIYADAEAAVQVTPGPTTTLRFGLILAIPGHPGSDPEMAVGLLRDVLIQTELLTPAETSLAQILLNSAERQIVASSETRRLRASSSRAQQSREQVVAEQQASIEAENRELRRALAEAEAKLEAITEIEQSIRDRE